MSYFSGKDYLAEIGADLDDANVDPSMPKGFIEPEVAYGASPNTMTFEAAVLRGIIQKIPESEWQDRLEALERNRATLIHRIDADWKRPLTQGRCGFCWAYSVIGAKMAKDASDGLPHRHYSAAWVAAQVKNGRDEGGWPTQATAFIAEHGMALESVHGDCTCKGSSCGGPRSGCPARDLRNIESTFAAARPHNLTAVEIPPRDMAAWLSCLFQGIPVAAGWTSTGAWCDGHAMCTTVPIRDSRRGWGGLPENSWGEYKRRTPVFQAPRGAVAIVDSTAPHEVAA